MKHLLHIWMSCLLLVVTTACEKDSKAEIFAPKVTTGSATDIYRKGATLSGTINNGGTVLVDRYGILFSELQSMAEYEELPATNEETEYSVQVKDLKPGKTYYFCSYAHSGYSIVRGEIRSFTTSRNNAPVFDIPVISATNESSFTVTATLLDDGGSELILSGFCYNEMGENAPTFMDNVANVEISNNTITTTFTGLYPGKTYQVRAYGATANGLAYSDLVTITTDESIVPFLSKVEVTDSTSNSLTIISNVIEAGSAEVTQVGFCYSYTNKEPDLNDNYIYIENLAGDYFSFVATIYNLLSTTYIRSYAINSYGIGYSEVFTYTPSYHGNNSNAGGRIVEAE